ncbi:MAG: dipeptidyl-peptidase 3 family protein [Longimicrobiales bacterium]
MSKRVILGVLFGATALGCAPEAGERPMSEIEAKLDQYTTVRLTTDLSVLSEAEKAMIPHLMEAADAMTDVYWLEAYGDRDAFLSSLDDPAARAYGIINFGPWDRIDGNAPWLAGVGPKPPGARFYPEDMTVEEFEAAVASAPDEGRALKSLYTLVRRDEGGHLVAVPYSEAFADAHGRAAAQLDAAADLAEEPGLKRYLRSRADALLSDEYQASDFAWMEMKDNGIDVVIGPIETYEDQLFGYKASHEAFVLVKDREWSSRLARYAAFLPDLQRGLPVPPEYKAETPGADADLNAYDVVYVGGDANAGSKTIAINLPNDPEVQLERGARRLQLKNAMRAKFDEILVPIAGILMDEDQRELVAFDAFFENTMFHEVAHGLGIKNVLDGSGTVREAMLDQASALEEGKADVLGLYMISALQEMGEMGAGHDLTENLVTFTASIFRSIRFGASSAHGRANVARFNYFQEMGAFSRDDATGTYRVDVDRTLEAMNSLSERILRFQGDGDYDGVVAFMAEYGGIRPQLQADLDRLAAAGIPVDIVYEQGVEVLGLTQ